MVLMVNMMMLILMMMVMLMAMMPMIVMLITSVTHSTFSTHSGISPPLRSLWRGQCGDVNPESLIHMLRHFVCTYVLRCPLCYYDFFENMLMMMMLMSWRVLLVWLHNDSPHMQNKRNPQSLCTLALKCPPRACWPEAPRDSGTT